MTTIDPQSTLAELVLGRPARAQVLEELGLDYCCHGQRTLAEAAAERDLDSRTLALTLAAAERVSESAPEGHVVPATSLSALCDHIVDSHHALLREQLPRIGELAGKVAERHGGEIPDLIELRERFQALSAGLIEHIEREEAGVFALCRELDDDGELAPQTRPELDLHEAAHADVDRALVEIRELAGGYDPAEARCRSHRALLESLRELERDLHQHIHEENNILFPRLRERLAA